MSKHIQNALFYRPPTPLLPFLRIYTSWGWLIFQNGSLIESAIAQLKLLGFCWKYPRVWKTRRLRLSLTLLRRQGTMINEKRGRWIHRYSRAEEEKGYFIGVQHFQLYVLMEMQVLDLTCFDFAKPSKFISTRFSWLKRILCHCDASPSFSWQGSFVPQRATSWKLPS